MTATCGPIFKLLRKDQECKWTKQCQKAFDDNKEYLLEPPILIPPVEGRPLIMYFTVLEDSIGCVLVQQDDSGQKEYAIYYLSKKVRHPISCPKAIKGSVLDDHLAYQPIDDDQSLQDDFPDEEIMYLKSKYYEEPLLEEEPDPESRWGLIFDGAVNAYGRGIGDIIVMPQSSHIPFTSRLVFDYTNNMAEYEACIMGLEEAIDLRIKILDVYGDSTLVVNQIKGEWETHHPGLNPYRDYARRMPEMDIVSSWSSLITLPNGSKLHLMPMLLNKW
ncbi:uncharacterized protein LOC131661794 [Vicia villosa]|uniref:uncharacterized protein LOC131661794 n=1 Tax=Vicia villosa TaxID=3911 RepID=UPI00273A76B2|nr:uncharacterized protein LOC131661794 [Vicia villosa]